MAKDKIQLLTEWESLRQKVQESEQNLDTVRTLIQKADTRRKQQHEREETEHWNRVLDHLERCLTEARARTEYLKLCKKRLEATFEQKYGLLPADEERDLIYEEAALLSALPPRTEQSIATAKRLLTLPLEQIARLTLQQVSALHRDIVRENVEAATSEILDELEAHPVGNLLWKKGAKRTPETNRHRLLRVALEKIAANRLDSLTEEETQAFLANYERLVEKLPTTLKDERLKRILHAAVQLLRRREQWRLQMK